MCLIFLEWEYLDESCEHTCEEWISKRRYHFYFRGKILKPVIKGTKLFKYYQENRIISKLLDLLLNYISI